MNRFRRAFCLSLLWLFAVSITSAATPPSASTPAPPATEPAKPYSRIGQIDHPAIAESSGIVASRKYPGVYWTHCDSGNLAEIYAITREGKFIAEFPVAAKNRDWEDIAIDDTGHIYIGDIGNNGGRHKELHVHQVDEPDPTVKYDGGRGPKLRVNKTWKLHFPDTPFDCESLFIWKGNGYVVSKLFTLLPATIYRFPLEDQKEPFVLERITSIAIHSPATAADISADGSRLAVLTYTGLNIFQIDGDIAKAGKVKPTYTRLIHASIEGCCFAPGGVLVTAESREVFFFPDQK
jgi:hypothetical protein